MLASAMAHVSNHDEAKSAPAAIGAASATPVRARRNGDGGGDKGGGGASSDGPQEGKGVFLPKGFLPEVEPFSDTVLERVRTHMFNAGTSEWVPRDEPLSDAELDCWREQSRWLVCPITGRRWGSKSAVLGVGLYHAPRFLCDAEKERQRAAAKLYAKPGAPPPGPEDPAEDYAGGDGGGPDGGGGAAAGSGGGAAASAAGAGAGADASEPERFCVYPNVARPPLRHIQHMGRLPDSTRLGHLECIIGPVFDIKAYNDGSRGNAKLGVKPARDRGVLDYDQQYNALNFVYYVDKGDGRMERKMCTNRLSFFIEEGHGRRVFPRNIESQLSLLVFRDASRLRDAVTGETDQRLLAICIKRTIPRILKAIVAEVLGNKAKASESRFNQGLRLYLLIHQVAIKLVVRYSETYKYLYRVVMRFVQNPMAAENYAEWPDLEELLIASSLVGLPWPVLREAFIRRLVVVLVRATAEQRSSRNAAERIRHIGHQNAAMLERILMEFSFFVANRPLIELDRVYSRCAGTLPRAERDRMRQMAEAVRDVDTLQKFWVAMGMDSALSEDREVTENITRYIDFTLKHVKTWEGMTMPDLEKIVVPSLKEQTAHGSVATMGILGVRDAHREAREKRDAEELAKHPGYPKLTVAGRLARKECCYPQCKRAFKVREHLFQHLKRVSQEHRRDYSVNHFKHVPSKEESFGTECTACKERFSSTEALHNHYILAGVSKYFHSVSYADYCRLYDRAHSGAPDGGGEAEASAAGAGADSAAATGGGAASGGGASASAAGAGALAEPLPKDQYEDLETCCVCMDAERQVVLAPCGHLVTCKDCGKRLRLCPVCRTLVRARVPVLYALSSKSKLTVYRV